MFNIFNFINEDIYGVNVPLILFIANDKYVKVVNCLISDGIFPFKLFPLKSINSIVGHILPPFAILTIDIVPYNLLLFNLK